MKKIDSKKKPMQRRRKGKPRTIEHHEVNDSGNWRPVKHGEVKGGEVDIEIRSCEEDFKFLNLYARAFNATVRAVPDSGLKWWLEVMKKLKVQDEYLTPVSLKIWVADS